MGCRCYSHIAESLKTGPGDRGREGWAVAATLAREPPWLCADTDAPAVLVVLRGPAQVIPGTLGADTAQVGAIRLDAFVNSLLLGKNQRARVPSANQWPKVTTTFPVFTEFL